MFIMIFIVCPGIINWIEIVFVQTRKTIDVKSQNFPFIMKTAGSCKETAGKETGMVLSPL